MTPEPKNRLPIDQMLVENGMLREEAAKLKQQLEEARAGKANFTLPPPQFPTMDMPQQPNVKHQLPEEAIKPACDGTPYDLPDPSSSSIPPPALGKVRILIVVPLLMITYEFFESFLKFWTSLLLNPNPNMEFGYHFAYRKPVHMAEEYLVKTAQYNKATHILFMDDDVYDVTRADLEKLVAADKDVIGGVMHASKFPHAMCVFRRYMPDRKVIDMPADNSMYRLYEVPCLCHNCGVQVSHWDAPFCISCGSKLDNLIQQADLIPFAFTLMKMSVFDKIKKPWFHCTNTYPTDSWFADRLIEAGMTEYAHMGVRLNHAGVSDLTKPFFMQMGMEKAKTTGSVVNITPDEMNKHQYLLMHKMKETEDRMKAKPPIISDGKVVASPSNDGGRDVTLVSHGVLR